jgi:hypothetical protein
MFPIKSIMKLPLLGSVASGHRTIRFLLVNDRQLSVKYSAKKWAANGSVAEYPVTAAETSICLNFVL